MHKKSQRFTTYFFTLLLIASLACSFTPSLPLSSPSVEPGFRYDDLPQKNTKNTPIAEYQAISKWDTLDIQYYFADGTAKLSDDSEKDVIKRAFALWAAQTPLTFSETTSANDAEIIVEWAVGDHGDGDPFDGPGDVLAHASFPNPYDERQVFLHFDDDERWVDSDTQNVDLLTVAAHEIGHTLGLGHSEDTNALMYAAYSGPHRFLDNDDVSGIEGLYGAARAPQPAPGVPGNNAPPPTTGEDQDRDGIADQDELLVTGTDPNNPDSDSDGLGDGVEVENHMNPLDGDMDKDGVSDGQEVTQGTDPFFPEQSDVSSELENEVSDFLTNAIETEIEAYRNNDASITSAVMRGNILTTLQEDIASLQQGRVVISEIDYYKSFINDIRVIDTSQIEVDTCEMWTNETYQQSDGQLIESEGPSLVPQTITIQQLDSNWYITDVQFHDAPSFCT